MAGGVPAQSDLPDVLEPLRADLEAVGKAYARILESRAPQVAEMVAHVGRFTGKRLRPALTCIASRIVCGAVPPDAASVAAVVELIHTATLVHDDVLDEAELRRKGATINHLRGNEAAVLLGDYLISHSYHLCSSLDSQHASRLIARTTNQVCEGELLQIDNRNNIDLDEKTYLQIITRKTASLCAACCALGAHLAGADGQTVARMEHYGLSLGTAFQIQDDILDIVGDADVVGKTLGIDVEKGKMTLPIIHFLRTAPREHRALLRSLLASRDADKIDRIRNLILPSDSIEYAQSRARRLVEEARLALADLPDSEARGVLDMMAEFVVARSN